MTKTTVLLFVALLFVSVGCGGCKSLETPEQKYLVASELFTRTVNAVAGMIESGVIPMEQKPEIVAAAEAGDAALDAIAASLLSGDKETLSVAWKSFNAAVEVLLKARTAALEGGE